MISEPVLIAVVSSMPPTLAAVAALVVGLKNARKVEQVHRATNSLTDRLVALTRLEAHAAGVKQGREERSLADDV